MTSADPAREAWGCFVRMFMSAEVHDRLHAACDEAGLPHPGAMKALLWLYPDELPSMRAIADALHCDASYVTSLVDALEDLGYVERRVSPHDRRVKLVHLTRQGAKARERALNHLLTPPKGFARLRDAEVRTLHRLLARAADGYGWR